VIALEERKAHEISPVALVDVDGTILNGQSYRGFLQSLWGSRQRRVRLLLGIMMALPSRFMWNQVLA
jgi:hypothetical protein